MRIDVFGDNIGYVTDEVSNISNTECNLNEENRIKWVTDLASISRGKYESKNPKVRYDQLLKEASPTMKDLNPSKERIWLVYKPDNKDNHWIVADNDELNGRPSRPLEFLPIIYGFEEIKETEFESKVILTYKKGDDLIKLQCSGHHFLNTIAKHSHIYQGILYTNMRTMINSGLDYKYIPYSDSPLYRSFKAIRIKVPMFVFGQLMTHTMISKESQSDRVAESTEYWLPNDFIEKLIEYNINHPKMQANISTDNKDVLTADTVNAILNLRMYAVSIRNNETTREEVHNNLVKELLNSYSQNVVQNIFKFLEYKREIWSRAIYYFKYKEMILTGWNNDPEVWEHLFLEREVYPDKHKSWVQEETRRVCEAIAKVIEK